MNRRIHLALPPNIARRARTEIAARFPAMEIDAPATHREMYGFAQASGEQPPPALSVSAYPQLMRNMLQSSGKGFRPIEGGLPELRRELAGLGMQPPLAHLRLIAVAPCVLVYNPVRLSRLEDWADLCGREFLTAVGTPPADTPLPYLVRHHLQTTCNRQPAGGLDMRSSPLDINKRVDAGELAAGVLIPAFGRAFRQGEARMIWPRSGALAVPLAACLGEEAAPEAQEVLDYLLSREFQTFLAESGGLVPVSAEAPGFPELDQAEWRLNWAGWDALLRVAERMTGSLTEQIS
jgi:hypothetical protein